MLKPKRTRARARKGGHCERGREKEGGKKAEEPAAPEPAPVATPEAPAPATEEGVGFFEQAWAKVGERRGEDGVWMRARDAPCGLCAALARPRPVRAGAARVPASMQPRS